MFYKNYRIVLMFVALIWVLQVTALIGSIRLDGSMMGQSNWAWGLEPRSISGLLGIFFMPFIHGSIEHVAGNSFGLLLLGAVLCATAPEKMWRMTFFVVVVGGLGIWLFGRPPVHVGASGVIFGWIGFLLLRGVFERRLVAIVGSLIVAWFYADQVLGMFSVDASVSWEGHLFSLLAGMAAVFVFKDTDGFQKKDRQRDSAALSNNVAERWLRK